MIVEVAIFFVTLLILLSIYEYITTPPNLPPGPRPLPLLGNLHNIVGSELHLEATRLTKEYGDVMTLRILGENIIFINSGVAAKEAMLGKNTDDFAGRPKKFTFDLLTRGFKDIIFGDYSPALNWRRKVCHSGLRMYSQSFVSEIVTQLKTFEEHLRESHVSPVDSRDEITLLVLNITCSFVCGKAYEISDPDFAKIKRFNILTAEVPITLCILNVFPWLIHFPLTSSRQFKALRNIRDDVLDRIFKEHKDTFKEGHIRDLTDAFLQAKLDIEREDKKAIGEVTDDHVTMLISDIFGGGLETTISTLRWCVAYMIHYPEVQIRAQAELDTVIGDEYPRLSDRDKLPYIEAVIAETLRLGSNVPLAIPHKATRNASLMGYTIPKNTTVLLNLWAILRDPNEWEQPDMFHPDRFINGDGKFAVPTKQSFFPFSLGRRTCVGQSLAKTELFLIIARLLQQFTLEAPPGLPPPDLKGVVGVTRFAAPYKFCAKPRKV